MANSPLLQMPLLKSDYKGASLNGGTKIPEGLQIIMQNLNNQLSGYTAGITDFKHGFHIPGAFHLGTINDVYKGLAVWSAMERRVLNYDELLGYGMPSESLFMFKKYNRPRSTSQTGIDLPDLVTNGPDYGSSEPYIEEMFHYFDKGICPLLEDFNSDFGFNKGTGPYKDDYFVTVGPAWSLEYTIYSMIYLYQGYGRDVTSPNVIFDNQGLPSRDFNTNFLGQSLASYPLLRVPKDYDNFPAYIVNQISPTFQKQPFMNFVYMLRFKDFYNNNLIMATNFYNRVIMNKNFRNKKYGDKFLKLFESTLGFDPTLKPDDSLSPRV